MIRFVKNILDVKNVLGMDRQPIPDPQYPANMTVIRSVANSTFLMLTLAGDVKVTYIHNGSEVIVYLLRSLWSGVAYRVTADPETDIKIEGNATGITINGAYKYSFVSIGNTIQSTVGVNTSQYLTTLDFRNSTALGGFTAIATAHVKTVYANASTPLLANIMTSVINGSLESDCKLYIDPNDAYAASVIATAESRGWEIHNL